MGELRKYHHRATAVRWVAVCEHCGELVIEEFDEEGGTYWLHIDEERR